MPQQQHQGADLREGFGQRLAVQVHADAAAARAAGGGCSAVDGPGLAPDQRPTKALAERFVAASLIEFTASLISS